MTGTLYLCATPIGNLGDMTERGIEILKGADLIVAEDTRRSRVLLSHFGISVPMTSYHEHNSREKTPMLIRRLLDGENMALITDAGTPGISDPGEGLVSECIKNGIRVTAAPGACAAIMALIISGFPAGRFCFEGFLPRKRAEMESRLEELSHETRTVIIYEAPHRIEGTLKAMCATLGENRRICICRELTKLYEEAVYCTLGEAAGRAGCEKPRGEYVIVMEGVPEAEIAARSFKKWASIPLKEHLKIYMADGLDKKAAIKRMATDRGCGRRDIYQALLDED